MSTQQDAHGTQDLELGGIEDLRTARDDLAVGEQPGQGQPGSFDACRCKAWVR